MKKKSVVLVIIILILSFAVSSPYFESLMDTVGEKIAVYNSKPTSQEIEEFYAYLAEDTYYYYNGLNDSDKKAYETMYASFVNFDESFTIELSASRLSYILMSVMYDNPHIFWINFDYEYIENENTIELYPIYTMSKTEADTISEKLGNKINEIVSNMDVSLTDYEKELFIHDYVCNNTDYVEETYETNGYTAYSSLLNGESICEGYSRAIQMLLNKVDIDNYLVVGNGISEDGQEPHMWNIVTINGENYHLDATWDDPVGENEIYYYYFNVTDDYISKDHTDIVPSSNDCKSMTYNYFVVEQTYIEKFNGFSEHINRSVDILRQGENTVEFIFKNSNDYKKALKMIENDNYFFDYVSACISKSGRKLNRDKIEYYTYDDENHLSVVFLEE